MMSSKTPVILIVDDDKLIRQTLSDILEQKGYRPLMAESGDELEKLLESEEIDTILLDINLPGENGIEITRHLKNDERFRHIPIVIQTGQNQRETRIEALKAGADDFLLKPVHIEELNARMKSLVKVKAYNDMLINNQQVLENMVTQRTIELENALKKVKKASLDTIQRLVRAAEYKDEDTATHILRMSAYSAAIAEELGLPDGKVDLILSSASMHDIGKMGIPDHILLKPGKLTPDEWKVMKEHTVIGARILSDSDNELIKTGNIIALTHHEKWNGSGYPRGLKGSEIPLEGRICAVADVFDALTTKRPYKEAYTYDQSIKIIKEGKGTHFDPEITDLFLDIQSRILSIMSQSENY